MEIRGKSWDDYWRDSAPHRGLYALLARAYRRWIISLAVAHFFRSTFSDAPGRVYVHAGCGSAETDSRIGYREATIVLMDISVEALKIARATTRFPKAHVVCGDLFAPPFRTSSIDGAWNLGVVEHFYEPEIRRIFAGLGRILKPDASALILWPPVYGLSVLVLTSFLFVVNRLLRRSVTLYPDEVSRYRSIDQARGLLAGSGLRAERTHFGIRDLFTYVVLVATRERAPASAPEATTSS